MDAVPAPFTSYAYYNADKFHFYGEELMRHCMAFRSLPGCRESTSQRGRISTRDRSRR